MRLEPCIIVRLFLNLSDSELSLMSFILMKMYVYADIFKLSQLSICLDGKRFLISEAYKVTFPEIENRLPSSKSVHETKIRTGNEK